MDPATNATVPCDFGNQTFIDALYKVYMDAAPLHLVDIWWTDYGGCGVSGGNPQLWNNIVIHEHQKYARGVRGQSFSRFGGVGNHRYPHGFSGDTFMHEVSLYWQVKTTQTAANVLWGYWSHDIGGFHDGQGCPGDATPSNATGAELLLRWIQWGAVAPILRTHCNHCERRIWMFPYFEEMRDAMYLRNALGPYLYTAARAFFDTGVAPVHPLYYEDAADATLFTPAVAEREYMHGDRILAAPITTMTGAPNGTLASWPVYLPAGTWSNWNGTQTWDGPATVDLPYALQDVPLFVRGGILPLKTMASVAGNFPDPLVWALFPGGGNTSRFTLYEDDGDSDAYQGGEFVTTAATLIGDPGKRASLRLTIGAAASAGALPAGFPQVRAHELQVRGLRGQAPAAVTANGAAVPAGEGTPGWSFAAGHSLAQPEGALLVRVGPQSSWAETVVEVAF